MTEDGYPTQQVCSSLQAAANAVRIVTAAAVENFSLRELSVFVIEGESVSIKMSTETGAVMLSHKGVKAVGRLPSSSMVELADGRLEPMESTAVSSQGDDTEEGFSALF